MNMLFKTLPKIDHSDFQRILKIIPEPVIVTDTNPCIVYVNPALEKLTGYKLAELVGKNPRILKSGKTPETVYQRLYRALTGGKSFSTREVINKRKDGSLYQIDASYVPIVTGGKTVFYVQIQHDITAHKKAEAELAGHAAELEKMNKSKDEFIYFASHTLRTPLSAVAWSIERLSEDNDGYSAKQQKSLNLIYDQTQRMIKLTNDLLDATRMEFGVLAYKYEETNPQTVASNVIIDLKDRIRKKKIKFKFTSGKDIRAYKTYSNAIYMILHNLLSNAVKFTPIGGKVGLKISKTEIELILQVSDSGIGIPRSAQEKIFQKMYRAQNVKDKFEGSGLGLYIISGIISHMGGKISVESKQGKGTTFTVWLPVTKGGIYE